MLVGAQTLSFHVLTCRLSLWGPISISLFHRSTTYNHMEDPLKQVLEHPKSPTSLMLQLRFPGWPRLSPAPPLCGLQGVPLTLLHSCPHFPLWSPEGESPSLYRFRSIS